METVFSIVGNYIWLCKHVRHVGHCCNCALFFFMCPAGSRAGVLTLFEIKRLHMNFTKGQRSEIMVANCTDINKNSSHDIFHSKLHKDYRGAVLILQHITREKEATKYRTVQQNEEPDYQATTEFVYMKTCKELQYL